MKREKWVFVIASAILFSGAGPSQGQTASSSAVKPLPTETSSTRLTRREIIKRLDLSDVQKKSLRQHKAAYRKSMAEIQGQLKVKQVELENELDKPEPDQDRLDAIIQKIADLYGQKLGAQVKAKLELEKKILTPQQVELLKTLQGKENSAGDDNL